jgi:hypothetical protein
MKKIFIPILACFILIACNNEKKDAGHDHHKKGIPKTQEDSLMADVMDGHDVGMAKYGRLGALEKKIKTSLDSIAKLPAKDQQAAAPIKAKLDSLGKDISYAIFAMDKWMEEFDMDSAKADLSQRIKYLTDEKMKVGKVKEAILTSLQKADSVFKSKF